MEAIILQADRSAVRSNRKNSLLGIGLLWCWTAWIVTGPNADGFQAILITLAIIISLLLLVPLTDRSRTHPVRPHHIEALQTYAASKGILLSDAKARNIISSSEADFHSRTKRSTSSEPLITLSPVTTHNNCDVYLEQHQHRWTLVKKDRKLMTMDADS